ncbi:hypothetical protein ACFXHA_45285 [Nocardia sp. NPDC059240]|uniref:hypothetical protein n=1 Tax=Nocardia sp. NPDC059240 TaxID=3346786 RepID=UPI00368DD4EF
MGIIVVGPRASAFLPSKMNKNGTANLTTSYAPVQGWTADTGSYPGSTVSSPDALVVQNTGASVKITVSATWSVGIGSTVVSLNITVNGGIVATIDSATASSGTTSTNWTGAVAQGDLIRMEAKAASAFQPSISAGFVQVV